MAGIWLRLDRQWTHYPLDRDLIGLGADHAVVPNTQDATALLARKLDKGQSRWALIVRPSGEMVRVNGDRVALGIRALRDRDAIQIGFGERIFFSTDSAPVVAPYAGTAPIPCARCGTDIQPGTPTVQCGRCGAYLHQSQELPCWLCSDRCLCDRATALSDDNCWIPDEE